MERWLVVSIVIALYLGVTLTIGLLAGRRSTHSVTGYVAADRSFGLLVMYFVTGASVFSAFAFLGGPGWAYSRGAAAFYILAYGALGMAPFYWIGPRIASLGRKFGYVTQAQLVTGRFPSRRLSALLALLSLVGLPALHHAADARSGHRHRGGHGRTRASLAGGSRGLRKSSSYMCFPQEPWPSDGPTPSRASSWS